jgi:hypothetical protein
MISTQQLDHEQAEWGLSDWQVFLAHLGFKVSVGLEARPGWKGHLEFFVFKCPGCGGLAKDYGHSWPETRYLTCSHCREHISWPVRLARLRQNLASLALLVRFRLAHGVLRNG